MVGMKRVCTYTKQGDRRTREMSTRQEAKKRLRPFPCPNPTGKGRARPVCLRVHRLGSYMCPLRALFVSCTYLHSFLPSSLLPNLPSPLLSSNRQTGPTHMRRILPSIFVLAAAACLGQVLPFLPLGPIVGFASCSSRSDRSTFQPRTLRACPRTSTGFGIGGSERPPLPRFKNTSRTRILLVRPSTSTSFEIGSSEVPPKVPSVAPKKQGYGAGRRRASRQLLLCGIYAERGEAVARALPR